MKIVHITNWQVPDYGYEEINLAKAQVRLGHSVDILASNFLYPKGDYSVLQARFPARKVDPRIESVDGVRIHRLASTEILQRTWLHGLGAILRSIQPDIIHCHNLLQFHPFRVSVLRLLGYWTGKLIVDDHMHPGFQRRDLSANLVYELMRKVATPFLATQADAFCAIAEDTAAYLRDACGVKGRINLVPLGVDTRLFKPCNPSAKHAAREQMLFEPTAVVYLYIGKVIRAKLVDEFVAAALTLMMRGLRSHAVIVGDSDSEYLSELTATVSNSGFEERFLFLPSRPYVDLPELYAAADVAVWPAQESMSLFEAMATGVAAIVSRGSGLAHFADEGLCAAFVAGGLVEAMAGLRDPELRGSLAQSAIAYAQANLSWDRCAERYMDVYQSRTSPAIYS